MTNILKFKNSESLMIYLATVEQDNIKKLKRIKEHIDNDKDLNEINQVIDDLYLNINIILVNSKRNEGVFNGI